MVKDGPTIIAYDGQNTAIDVAGVRTLVVADPLSNLRQRVGGLIEDERPATEKVTSLDFETLAPDPYDQLALVVHEAFHVHQHRVAPDRGANEMFLLYYPVLSVENNVAFGLEARRCATPSTRRTMRRFAPPRSAGSRSASSGAARCRHARSSTRMAPSSTRGSPSTPNTACSRCWKGARRAPS